MLRSRKFAKYLLIDYTFIKKPLYTTQIQKPLTQSTEEYRL